MNYFKDKNTGEVYAYETEEERLKWGADDLVAMTPEEVDEHLNPVPTTEQLAAAARAKRDSLLAQLEPRLLRYERQERLGIETNDTEAWYFSALQRAQDLRDVPQQEGFPNEIEWPE